MSKVAEPTPRSVRALTFFSLVAAIVGLIFINRSFSASIVIADTCSSGPVTQGRIGVAGDEIFNGLDVQQNRPRGAIKREVVE
jgi:hypothetical protein